MVLSVSVRLMRSIVIVSVVMSISWLWLLLLRCGELLVVLFVCLNVLLVIFVI